MPPRLGIYRRRAARAAPALPSLVRRVAELGAAARKLGEPEGRGAALQLEGRASGLRAGLLEGRRRQEELLLPQLAGAEALRQEAQETAGRVEEAHQDWRVQEAAAVAADTDLWGEVEGRGLAAAVRDVRVAVTRLGRPAGP